MEAYFHFFSGTQREKEASTSHLASSQPTQTPLISNSTGNPEEELHSILVSVFSFHLAEYSVCVWLGSKPHFHHLCLGSLLLLC